MKYVDLKSYITYVSRGITPKYVNSEGILVINQRCIRNGQIDFSYARLTSKQKSYTEAKFLEPGDILINSTGTGTLGRIALFKGNDQKVLADSHVSIVRISQEYDTRFVAHYLYSKEAYIATLGKGATNQQELSKEAIYSIPVPKITVDKQSKIAEILSAYDDLIENNQKQIKLLEEAAMWLYKEWFVKLRFPGHEKTKIEDGVPEGWKLTRVKRMGQVITGKTPSTAIVENYDEDIPFVKIPDMHGVIYPLKTEVKLSERGANTQKNKFLPPKSIMVSCIATVGLVCITHEVCQTNQQINSIVLNDEDHLYYMFFKMKGIKSLLEGVGSNGATMTNVNKTKFENIELLKPENEILKKFNNLVEPFFSNILALSKQNEKLKEARDKLLSKLMSGEIEV
jgi:type I restriction enzyme S subunit